MKKTTSLFVLLSASVLNATIITVDNKVPSIGDYMTLQEAHNAASNGDTIYVHPSTVTYSGIDVDKTLTFIGTGFTADFFENGVLNSKVGAMNFQNGSDGSVFEGFEGVYIIIQANNITIRRNRLTQIQIYENHTGNILSQNTIISSGSTVFIAPSNSAWVVNNIIITNHPTASIACIEGEVNSSLMILNNVLNRLNSSNIAIDVQGESYVINNILVQGNIINSSSVLYLYNMSSGNILPAGNGNINNVDMTTVFVDHANEDYHLLPNSPAIGAGQNGVDMGIYGGSNAFVDGGYPSLPAIIRLQAESIVKQADGLDVIIKAISNKK